MMLNFENKSVVITGSSRGFGLALAHAFLDAGANVVISSRSQTSLDQALAELDQPDRCAGTICDVSRFADIQALVHHTLTRFGNLEFWINNAGISAAYGPTLGVSPHSFESVVQTNILGTYYGSLTALQHFNHQKHGKLINILGHGAKGPVPYQSAYSSSKIWIRSFTQSLIVENNGLNVSIFGFNPGMMATQLLTDIDVVEGYESKLKGFPTIVRLFSLPPQIPALAVVKLASSATDGQPGKIISMNSSGYILGNLLREMSRRLTGKPAPVIKINSFPYGQA